MADARRSRTRDRVYDAARIGAFAELKRRTIVARAPAGF